MGWKEYKEKLGVKHTFEQFGCKDFWVKLRRLDSFPYGKSKKSSSVSQGQLTEAASDPKKIEEYRKEIEDQLIVCILDWHIPDPTIQDNASVSDEDKAKSMPPPVSDDVTSLDKLPSEFIGAMFIWLREDSDLAKRVPKVKGTPSGRR